MLSKVYLTCPNTSPFGLPKDLSHLLTHLPSSQCGREWAWPHHPTPHQALYSVHPQHVWPQAVSGLNPLFVCLFVQGTLKYTLPAPPSTQLLNC